MAASGQIHDPHPVNKYLAHSEVIDWRTPSVLSQAHILANGASDDELVTERCFIWVRDHVRHSHDHRIPVVTLSASSVLEHRAGYCYAKAHLLAALLRASGIAAALCYQRLQLSGSDPRFTLHGLNAVFLRRHGWYRLDARGNKPGVDAQFCPPAERLAFSPTVSGERDLPGLFAEPLPAIVSILSRCSTEDEVYHALPDFDDELSFNLNVS
jgi:transglutaminase-like putative cysteine protease